jgi:hemin uptake protein HemP
VSEDRPCGDDAGQSLANAQGDSPRIISSSDILHGAREVIIQHGEERYRLRVTKAGKLILNK